MKFVEEDGLLHNEQHRLYENSVLFSVLNIS